VRGMDDNLCVSFLLEGLVLAIYVGGRFGVPTVGCWMFQCGVVLETQANRPSDRPALGGKEVWSHVTSVIHASNWGKRKPMDIWGQVS